MKLPRDLSGRELAAMLRVFGYEGVRQTGSHIRLTSNYRGTEHHITIPAHGPLKVGTLNAILSDVASYLEIQSPELREKLFR